MNDQQSDIERIKAQILELGPVLPGSLSKQWNVCGSQGCRCKDPKRPRKHGPYYQLSFTVGGKSSTMFIKKEHLQEARVRIKRYVEFRTLCVELVRAYIALARQGGFDGRLS